MTRIAVVEDNSDLLDDTCFELQHAGFEVQGVANGRSLRALLPRFAPHIVLLDLGLPDEDGLALAGWLRSTQPQLGIVMLTARTARQDRLAGHAEGADHYLCKPVDAEELVAVLRALERRLMLPQAAQWVLDTRLLQLHSPQGHCMALNVAELGILGALARLPRRQASRRELVEALGEDWLLYDERRLEAVISRLRRKIADTTGADAPLRTLRGFGYTFLESLHTR